MSELKKATLQEISSDENSTPIGDPVDVQFNPSTLRLQLQNTLEGGDSRGRQVRQYIGSSSTTLSLDLIFDTADEGTTAQPRSVREKTAMVERFVVPGAATNEEKQVVPRVRFHWGNLILDGVIDGITLDFDHFASDGTPLRAKVTISIKEQNGKYQFLAAGPGANRAGNAPLAGGFGLGIAGGASLGLGLSAGFSAGISVGLGAGVSAGFGASFSASAGAQASFALEGESAAEFSARVGMDPGAWRGLTAPGQDSLSFSAGAEIGFSANVSASAGLGASFAASAGTSTSVEASFGLEAPGNVAQARSSAFTLSSAGGVTAALESVQIARSQSAERSTREAFQTAPPAPSPSVGAKPTPPVQTRTPLAISGPPAPAVQKGALPAPPPPRADRRAASFGYGVPLRPNVGQGTADRSSSLAGAVPLIGRKSTVEGQPPAAVDPSTPPWVALPARPKGSEAEARQTKLHPAGACGCHDCRHGRKR